MLSSTKEYLQALREGKYLLFLEWPQFIAVHYQKEEMLQDADDIISILVFEWLSNDYSESDAKKIALLCAVNDSTIKPIRGSISYALTTISIAVFQCMLYQNNALLDKFLSKKNLDKRQVLALINDVMKEIDKGVFENMLIKEQATFYNWVAEISSKEIEGVCRQIRPIAELRYLSEEYSFQLAAYKKQADTLKTARLSVVKRLVRYLNEQTELTEEVKLEISAYVDKIREMQPVDFERDYLASLSPPSLMENSWELLTRVGLSFFNLLQPIQTTPIVPQQQEATSKIR